jgi:iron complex outermembrane receptor protein
MTNRKRVFWATTALFSGLLVAGAASAQSSGTVATEATELDTVVVTGTRAPFTTDGSIVAETVAKTRSTITQEFISTQSPGQTILQTLNLVPGLNFVNADPFGNSGGNIRLRGFDGNRVSLTFDGIPLNDTGNYATFTNQQLDPELIERAAVNTGTTDVDSPTASATGGTINYTTARPLEEMGAQFNASFGEFNYRRLFTRFDTGAFGPWDTTAYFTFSGTDYDKFKGPGNLEKRQYNGRIYQNLGDGNFASLSAHFNRNRNDFYNNFITQAQFNSGTYLEQDAACRMPTPAGGTAQNDNTQATFTRSDGTTGTGSCTNFYGLRINPSNTGNIRAQSKFTFIPDTLTFTLDSAVQYTLANGGGSTVIAENSALVRGDETAKPAGLDLNGDGDILDSVRLYTPNTTNTRRYTTLASLIWNINDSNTVRFAYTYDYGDHRQTGHYGLLNPISGQPQDVFGGKDGNGRKVLNADGYALRTRDRQSFAILNQFSLEYRGKFFDDALQVNLGLRAPTFDRDLNQFCLSQRGSTTVLCTTQATYPGDVTAGVQSNPNVVSLVPAGTGTLYIVPYDRSVSYDAVLPNVGVSWRFAEGHTVFASYAEGLSAPRTDNLYTVGFDTTTNTVTNSDVEPETSKAWDFGYRYKSANVIFSSALWFNEFDNRIVSAFDPDLGFSVDRNVGSVKLWGLDAQAGWTPNETFSLYGSLSYTNSELQDNLSLGTNLELPTKGKVLVETPEWMAAFRAQYNITEDLSVSLQGKHVGNRYTTDVNDEETPAYAVFDMDVRYDLPWFNDKGAYVQLNVTNIFDEEYFGNISSGTNAKTILDVNTTAAVTSRAPNTAFVSVGAPRTVQVTFSARF